MAMKCNYIGCFKEHKSKGFCNLHYTRFRKYGDPSFRIKKANGEGSINRQGYKLIYTNGKQVKEHRIIMEKYIKRKLLPFPIEIIHHKNGNRLDNRIKNLELISQSEHVIYHRRKSKVIGNSRICSDCKKFMSFDSYNKDKYTKTGYRNYCKKCHIIRNKKYL